MPDPTKPVELAAALYARLALAQELQDNLLPPVVWPADPVPKLTPIGWNSGETAGGSPRMHLVCICFPPGFAMLEIELGDYDGVSVLIDGDQMDTFDLGRQLGIPETDIDTQELFDDAVAKLFERFDSLLKGACYRAERAVADEVHQQLAVELGLPPADETIVENGAK